MATKDTTPAIDSSEGSTSIAKAAIAVPKPEGFVVIIAVPEKEVLAKGIKRLGPVRFPSIVQGEGGHGVEVNGNFIAPGSSNSFSLEAFALMQTNPHFAKQLRAGAIRVVHPEVHAGTKATNTTLDYSLSDAFQIIEQSTDADWLGRSLNRDDRDGIVEACQARVADIEAMIQTQGQ